MSVSFRHSTPMLEPYSDWDRAALSMRAAADEDEHRPQFGVAPLPQARPLELGPISFIPLRFELVDLQLLRSPSGPARLAVTVRVIDRSTTKGEPLLLSRETLVPRDEFDFQAPALAQWEMVAKHVRAAVLWLMAHELDECLHLDGQRLNDPHAESAAR